MINQAKKKLLIECIKDREARREGEILLSPEAYFDGYDAPQCAICANNRTPIPTSVFAGRLRELQQRPEVAGIFIRFYEYTDAMEFDDAWIGSDTVYLLTSAAPGTVRQWFADFEVSDVWVEEDLTCFPDVPEVPDGFHLVAAWWD